MISLPEIAQRYIKVPFSLIETDNDFEIQSEQAIKVDKKRIQFEYQQAIKLERTNQETKRRILEIASIEDQINAQSTALSILSDPKWFESKENIEMIERLKLELSRIRNVLACGEALKKKITQTKSIKAIGLIDPEKDEYWVVKND